MSLMSSIFLLFLLCFVLSYFLLPKKLQPYVLFVFNILFLLFNSFNIFVLLEALIILLVSYFGGRLINKYNGNKKSLIFCLLSVFIILGELFILKYLNFFVLTFNTLFNTEFNSFNFVSVLGISYFSLMMIGYLIDIYRDTIKCEKNIIKLVNYVFYFPLLTSGPFIRYEEYGKEISKEHKFDKNKFFFGILRIVFGFFKVFVISNRLNIFINGVYGSLGEFNGILIFISCLLYTLELYTNFSGCIDIVLGISTMIGIDLPENFDNPFCSKSISEFWRRWHITLGAWLKDYIFYPLLKSSFIQGMMSSLKKNFSKKTSKKIPTYLSMLILWLLIGFWHGGEYKFILASGLFQFVYIVLEELLSPVGDKINNKLHINSNSKIYGFYQIVRTYILFSISMIFFRATDIVDGINIFKGLFNFSNINSFNLISLSMLDYIVIFIGCIFVLVVDSYRNTIFEKYNKIKFEYKLIIFLTLLLVIILFGVYGIGFDHNSFIYGSF